MLLLILILAGACLQTEFLQCQLESAQEQQAKIKRLILKDGTFEAIRQYSIQKDRVRYFSAERLGWEELPSDLVDWDATEKYARSAAQENADRMKGVLESEAKRSREEEARTPLVAPGIRLTSPNSVFFLDALKDKPVLTPLTQNGADWNKNTGGNILRGTINPISGVRQTIELKGLHASIQSHIPDPIFYFPVDAKDAFAEYDSKTAKDHLRIVRCQPKKDNRIVVTYNVALYGKVTQRAQYIGITVEPVSDNWVKITPTLALQPGEYALFELIDKGEVNQYVWDFGVNPDAPPNPVMPISDPEKSTPVLLKKTGTKTN
jgi:hypothetical protein